jgi:hypothetical protein
MRCDGDNHRAAHLRDPSWHTAYSPASTLPKTFDFVPIASYVCFDLGVHGYFLTGKPEQMWRRWRTTVILVRAVSGPQRGHSITVTVVVYIQSPIGDTSGPVTCVLTLLRPRHPCSSSPTSPSKYQQLPCAWYRNVPASF